MLENSTIFRMRPLQSVSGKARPLNSPRVFVRRPLRHIVGMLNSVFVVLDFLRLALSSCVALQKFHASSPIEWVNEAPAALLLGPFPENVDLCRACCLCFGALRC